MAQDPQNSAAPRIAILMMGGGARAAYQVGVLKAIGRMLPAGAPTPFRIICGTSAGAINAASLATVADDYKKAVRRLDAVWRNFHVNQIFRSDALGITKTGLHWLLTMMLGGYMQRGPVYLLDRQPLNRLLKRYIRMENIEDMVERGILHAFSITASGYNSGQSVTFYQAAPEVEPWRRVRRVGSRAKITYKHLMASSAIPFIFEAVRVHREYFGDGSMRQISPLSAPIHLGADRIFVIGNRKEEDNNQERIVADAPPTLAQIAGHALNSIFLDSLESDLERLQRINRTVELIPEDERIEHGGLTLRRVESLQISPSEDLGQMAQPFSKLLPTPVKLLLRGIGAYRTEGSDLLSYLLFEREYCRELIALGFHDTMAREEEVRAFLEID